MPTPPARTGNHPPPWAAVALLSGAALAYEVLLTRLFALIQWHHFAYMVISLALLGYGISGTLLELAGGWLRRHFGAAFAAGAAGFGLTAVGGFLAAQRLPFNPLELAWDPRQALLLPAIYLLLALPFLCAATAVGLALWHCRGAVHRLYAADLLGAGAGAVGVVALLGGLEPARALVAIGALGLLAAALVPGLGRARLGLPLLALALLLTPAPWITLLPSPYKDLSQALAIAGAEPILHAHGPLGVIDVVANRRVPLRSAAGLSLAAPDRPAEQLALFLDGDALGAVNRLQGAPASAAWLDWVPTALPYHLLAAAGTGAPRVLVLGAGGGTEVLQGLQQGAATVDAVELNPQLVELMENPLAAFNGGLYQRPGVRVHVGEARGFVTRSRARWDLVQLALLDAFSVGSAGLHALSESYLYTVEAFAGYLDHLAPGGYLALTRWLRLPPRDSLKLLATAAAALERAGVADPGTRLALIRGWNTATLVVKNGPLEPADIAALKAFCRSRGFDPAWYPGMAAGEANRAHRLPQPYLHQGAVALLGPQRAAFMDRYPFLLRPASDDRPYFFHFFRWRALPHWLEQRANAGAAQLEWGYLVLVATLAQALLAGIALVILPLTLRRRRDPPPPGLRWRVLVYFGALGLGFLLLEIAFIQKLVLFLAHPLYALTVVLAGFLVFAGLGSAAAGRIGGGRRVMSRAVAVLVAVAAGGLALLGGLGGWLAGLPEGLRILAALGLVAPLGIAMGVPFPQGLAQLQSLAPGLVPWAWAINGCASVVSAALATVLAMAWGFTAVVILALGCYLAALAAWPRLAR